MDARVDGHRGLQRATDGLENRLEPVVYALPGAQADMHRRGRLVHQRLKEVAGQARLEVAERLRREVDVES
jgi:hypothetical protein